jgi:hypothetical protein
VNAPPATIPRTGWIVSAGYDTAFFTASLFVPMLLWVAFGFDLMTGVAVYLAFQLLFNMPHNFQTWTVSVLDDEDRGNNGRRYLIAFAVCVLGLGLPMLLSPDGVYPWVRTALIYWGYYHLVRQHYGFQRMYERKMGGVSPRESFWYGRYLDAVSYLPLLIRFGSVEKMTIHANGKSNWVFHPAFPQPVVLGLLALLGAVVLAAAVHHLVMWRQKRPAFGPRGLLFLAVTVCFALAGIVISDFIVAVAVVTAFHNLQYLGLLWFHNQNRAAAGETAGNAPLTWIATGKLPLYLGISFLYGIAIFLPRALFRSSVIAELPIASVVALHYYVDARIWRFKDYPKRGKWLKLSA